MVRPHAGHRMFMRPLYPLYRCGGDPPVLFVRPIGPFNAFPNEEACQSVGTKLPGIVLGVAPDTPRDYEGDPAWHLFHYF